MCITQNSSLVNWRKTKMDKILEKLAGVLTAEDLQEIKESFESAVE